MCMFKFNLLSKWPIGFFIPSDIGSHNFLCSVLHMTSILKFKHLLLWYIPALLTVFFDCAVNQPQQKNEDKPPNEEEKK